MSDKDKPTIRLEDLVASPVGGFRESRRTTAPAAPVIPEVKEVTDYAFSSRTEYKLLSDGNAVYAVPAFDMSLDDIRADISYVLESAGVSDRKFPKNPERSYALVDENSRTVKWGGKEVKAVKISISQDAHGRDEKDNPIEFTTNDVVEYMKAQKLRGGSGTQALDEKLNAIRVYRSEFKIAEAVLESQTALANFVDVFSADPSSALGALMEENRKFLPKDSGNLQRDGGKISVHASGNDVTVELKPNPTYRGNVDVFVTYPKDAERGDVEAINKAVNTLLGDAAKDLPRKAGSLNAPFVSIPADKLHTHTAKVLEAKIEGERVAGVAMRSIVNAARYANPDDPPAPAPGVAGMATRVASLEELVEQAQRNEDVRAVLRKHIDELLAPKNNDNVTMNDMINAYADSQARAARITIEDLLDAHTNPQQDVLAQLVERHVALVAVRAKRGQTR